MSNSWETLGLSLQDITNQGIVHIEIRICNFKGTKGCILDFVMSELQLYVAQDAIWMDRYIG